MLNFFLIDSDPPSVKKKLELVGQYSLFGNIETLQAVRLMGNTRDSLLLSFKSAKVTKLHIISLS